MTDPVSISSLKSNDQVLNNDGDKANCLNKYLSSVFTTENYEEVLVVNASYCNMLDIKVTKKGDQNLLSKIDVNKSTGPDELSP